MKYEATFKDQAFQELGNQICSREMPGIRTAHEEDNERELSFIAKSAAGARVSTAAKRYTFELAIELSCARAIALMYSRYVYISEANERDLPRDLPPCSRVNFPRTRPYYSFLSFSPPRASPRRRDRRDFSSGI